jgi:hypothetical protein
MLHTTAVLLLQSPYSVQLRPGGKASEEYRDAEAFEPERKYSFFCKLLTVPHHHWLLSAAYSLYMLLSWSMLLAACCVQISHFTSVVHTLALTTAAAVVAALTGAVYYCGRLREGNHRNTTTSAGHDSVLKYSAHYDSTRP